MATRHDSPGPDQCVWSSSPAARPPARSHRFRLPRRRVFTLAILAFNTLMPTWVISAITSHASTCHRLTVARWRKG